MSSRVSSASGADNSSDVDSTDGCSSDSGSEFLMSGSDESEYSNSNSTTSSDQMSRCETESNIEDEDNEEDNEMRLLMEEANLPEHHSGIDLDAWNVTVCPQDLVRIFGPMTPVQLASYNHNPPKDVPMYENWTLVATVNSRIYVHPDKCIDLVEAIQEQGHIIIAGNSTKSLIRGHAHMTIGNLASAMDAVEIDAVRVTGYGMKHFFNGTEQDIGIAEHRLDNANGKKKS